MIGSKLQERYELRERLGHGGMGVVYRAYDPVLNRDVAIKMIPPLQLNRETEERFQREAQLVAGMDHPTIVAIHDFGRHEGSLFFVMPFVDGTLLQSLIQEASLRLGEILDIAAQVAEALDYSHSRGVIHRDVKPANVMVTPGLNGPRVRVLDFGLARGAAERRLTKTGGLVGTLSNLSPEQITSGTVDPRSDVYALGTVLYEALTGTPPFSGAVHSVLYRIVHEPAKTITGQGFDYGKPIDDLVMRCLAKDPAARPQRGADLAAELAEIRDHLDDDERLRTIGNPSQPVTLRPTQPVASPLIGRQKQWAQLQGRLAAALTGEGQLTLIEGDAGTGKSRLLLELELLARARRIRVLRGRFVDHEAAIPYQGLCELVQDYFRQYETVDSSSGGLTGSRDALPPGPAADFSDLAGDLVSFFPLLSEVRELRGQAAPTPSGGEEAVLSLAPHETSDPTRLFELLARALARIGGGEPLVLLIENLHEGSVSLAALAYIVRRLGPTPTLIVGTFRRAEISTGHRLAKMLKSFSGDPRFCLIRLGPFGAEDFRRLVELQLGNAAIRDELVGRLFEATEGNPYFGQELVRWLLETGGLSRDESGSWALVSHSGFATEALPATIQQAVERRIERLEPPLRHVLSLASVLGKNFSYEDLEALVRIDEADVGDLDDAIDQLVDDGLLEEDAKSRDDRLHFSRGVVRDILYHELSRRKRRSLHRRYAQGLEKRHRSRLERFYPQLVHHFSEGDAGPQTIRYALLMARKALASFSPDDAIHALRAALDFVDDDSPADISGELHELLAAAYRTSGSIAKALKEAEKAADAFELSGHGDRASACALLAAEAAWQTRRVDDARPWVDRGIELAQTAGAADVLRRLLTLGATVANLRGEHQQARRFLEDAERLAPAEDNGGEEDELATGGTLHAVLPNAVHTVDPAKLRTDEEFEVAANVFETLIDADVDGNLIPSLCEEWISMEGGRLFELTLTPGVVFSDGKPLDARDVVSAVERSKKDGVFRGAGFSAIRELEVSDPGDGRPARKLRFHLAEPLPIFPALLSDASTAIAREVRGGHGEVQLVGTGPFRLARLTEESVRLERNPDYWRGTPPPLEAVELHTSLDATGIAEGLRDGKIDVGRDLLPADLESIQRDPRFRNALVEATKKNVYFLLFNLSGDVACHRELRQALLGVVRVQDLVWRTLGRFAQPAVCLLPPGILGHDPGRRHGTLSREQAAQTLEEAALEAPVRLRAAIHPAFRDRYAALLAAIHDTWAELGVEILDQTPDMEEYLKYWSGHSGPSRSDADLLIGRWNADFDDPDNFTYNLFHSEEGLLSHFFGSAEADRVLERARQEIRTAQRLAHYQRFEELLTEDSVLLPLFHDIDYRVAGAHVRRLRLEARAPYVNYDRVVRLEAPPVAVHRRKLADGGDLHIGLRQRFETLDPSADNMGEHFEAKVNVFEPLTCLSEGARIVPLLAAFFEVPGGGSYHFRLREKVRFHDGRRLTARDVRYSFERILRAPGGKLHYLLLPVRGARALRDGRANDLKGFQILSAEQFVIELERPLSFFPALLTHPGMGIVPENADQFEGSWRDGCVGTGPFRVVRFTPGEGVDLEKNPHYWRPERPRAQRLQFHFGYTVERAVTEFRAGRLSLVGSLPGSQVEALRRDPQFAGGYHEAPRISTAFLAFNTVQGPFADPRLRRAFDAAIDTDAILGEMLGSGVIKAHGLLAPGLPGYEPRRSPVPTRESDADHLDDIEIRVVAHPTFLTQYADLWDKLHQTMAQMGLRIRMVPKSLSQAMESDTHRAIDLIAGRWIADYPDSDALVVGLLHSREGVMSGFIGRPQIDAKIEEGRRETDPTLRHAIYREIEEIIARERLLIPLFHEQNYRFVHPTVEGLKLGLSTPEVRYEELHVVR